MDNTSWTNSMPGSIFMVETLGSGVGTSCIPPCSTSYNKPRFKGTDFTDTYDLSARKSTFKPYLTIQYLIFPYVI